MKRLENFVDGKLVAPVSSQYMPIINPAHGKPYVEAPLSSTLDVDGRARQRRGPSSRGVVSLPVTAA
jgi:acyl-CoA reductase-like NAD-dependent aldehyde dehydrogenase